MHDFMRAEEFKSARNIYGETDDRERREPLKSLGFEFLTKNNYIDEENLFKVITNVSPIYDVVP